MTRNEELAWAAGFTDGEGTFGAYAGARTRAGISRRYLRVSVAQKNRALLDRLVVIFGCGHVYLDAKRGMHNYRVNGRKALAIANLLWPWLGEQKKADFKRALMRIKESRRQATLALALTSRECSANDCDVVFIPDVRHPDATHCSRRCYQRVWKREHRPEPIQHQCVGCGCHPDDRTRGCRRCMTRHWQRRKRGDPNGALQKQR